jgi:hypothetical protein
MMLLVVLLLARGFDASSHDAGGFASGFDASFAPRFRDDDAAGGSLARGFVASSHPGFDASGHNERLIERHVERLVERLIRLLPGSSAMISSSKVMEESSLESYGDTILSKINQQFFEA